jgi:ATP-dependent protease ClpP protease subunit
MDLGNNLGDDGTIICNLKLSGRIERDKDLRNLKTAIQSAFQVPTSSAWAIVQDTAKGKRLCLDSAGGSFLEAIDIAEFLIQQHIGTALLPGTRCESACAIVFMAGTGHLWSAPLNRFMHPSSVLAFHAPFLSIEGMENLPISTRMAVLSQKYDEGVSAVARLVVLALSDRFRFPTELLVEMLRRKPTDSYVIDTVGRAIRYRIHLFGASMPPLTEAAFCNVCPNFFYGAREQYGTAGKYPICIPQVLKPERKGFAKGFRLEFDAAPRGGTCVIDVETDAGSTKGWFLRRNVLQNADFANAGGDSVRLSYWYLYSPDTPMAQLTRH